LNTAPHRLGKYEFQQSLGKGNVGEVWKARDLSTKRDVALKIVYADLQRSDSQFLTRFMTDGQVLVTLRHPNLVPVLEVNVTRQEQSNEVTAYLAMEYIAGLTLDSYLQNTSHRGNFPPLLEIASLFACLGKALDYTYQKEIVHGNLAPDNILLNLQDTTHFLGGEPMLVDTGLAQILGSATNMHTKVPLYLSPEQAQGYPPTQRSDVYALGVILYEIYTGTVPFRGTSSVAIISQHIRALPTPPALINPIVPPALSEVILRAMAKDPVSRFPNVSTLAEAIAEAHTMPASLSISEQPAREDKKIPDQPVRRENSILGVAQPLSLPGTVQFRYSNVPSLIDDVEAPLPIVPAASSSPAKPIVTNPLPSEVNTSIQSSKPQPAQQSVAQIQNAVTLPPPGQQSATQIQGATTLPPPSYSQPTPTPNIPRTVSGPLTRPTLRPIEPRTPISGTQEISLSAMQNAQSAGRGYSANANVPQSTNTQSQPLFNLHQTTAFTPMTPRQAPPLNATGPVQPLQQAQPLAPAPFITKLRGQKKSTLYISLVALLALIIIGGTLIAFLLSNKGNAHQVVTVTGPDRVFFQDANGSHSNQLQINMQNVPDPPGGKTYFAWLQTTDQQSLPLGALSVQNSNVSFMYLGDSKRTNLISITQGILITTEDAGATPKNPSDVKVYQASFDTQLLDNLKYLLYATPGLPGQQSVLATILDSLHSIDDKAGSIVDSLGHDNGLVVRQATRMIETLDNTKQAQSSGDLPAKDASQLSIGIGLLSSPSQQGYLDILDAQIKQLQPLVANNTVIQQHLTNVQNALADLRDWLQKMHDYDVQLLKAADLQSSTVSGIALQIQQVSADSLNGHIIPPNSSAQPTLGSAGAQQAYSEAQYIATLYLQRA
jgi:serine/threonine protein kinase